MSIPLPEVDIAEHGPSPASLFTVLKGNEICESYIRRWLSGVWTYETMLLNVSYHLASAEWREQEEARRAEQERLNTERMP